jgi:hypothetical protein
MSYPRDLEEYRTGELIEELERRAAHRRAGLCDYCGRTPSTPPCKFPQRHAVGLTMWTIYKNPRDYPGRWVLRAWDMVGDHPDPIPRARQSLFDSLAAARAEVPPGLTCLPRQDDDDPAVFETWL